MCNTKANISFSKRANGKLNFAFLRLPLTTDQQILEPDWEVYLRDTARMVGEEQTPQRILQARERLYELVAHCIPAEIIFKVH
ncbi:unnamed protein product [Rotaria socialis]|uniref:Uncharacterized protein n=1 Tax=Rotaria socialis TaxID=392032 RepID=A0A817RMR1_9BILA|nr:unnamed protein product [Rotaria socialis]CAF3365404.1 unnamed protein product [Rotaria socialis]CAF3394807.1 unnamed protein product [Rotaria socialis]CAF3446947.1 unnamed protein product [Rotaria socialis]